MLDGKIIGDEDDERTRMMMSAFLGFAQDNPLTEEATLVKGAPATSANDLPNSTLAQLSLSQSKNNDFSSIGKTK